MILVWFKINFGIISLYKALETIRWIIVSNLAKCLLHFLNLLTIFPFLVQVLFKNNVMYVFEQKHVEVVMCRWFVRLGLKAVLGVLVELVLYSHFFVFFRMKLRQLRLCFLLRVKFYLFPNKVNVFFACLDFILEFDEVVL